MFSRRPGARFNRGRIATGGGSAFAVLNMTNLVEYWDVQDLSAFGDGGAVNTTWTGRKTGAVLTPFVSAAMGTYRANAFVGAGVTAGLEMSAQAAETQNATVAAIFSGTNKTYTVAWLGTLRAGGTNYYWSAGALVSTAEYVQWFFSGAAVVQNRFATRDGVINTVDNMTEFQALAPQLIEFERAAAGAWTSRKDGLVEGTATRSDSGVLAERFQIGGSSAGSGAAATSDMVVSAVLIFGPGGIVSGERTAFRQWAGTRLGTRWKKGLA
jgi:hypothetical protein